mmetsp:Transcript_4601/g.9259  ORF Transcript_4601/g.9259 Transcript_4601/m.9259 type:complete len:232 (-) Transcript_4601:264-959(-)
MSVALNDLIPQVQLREYLSRARQYSHRSVPLAEVPLYAPAGRVHYPVDILEPLLRSLAILHSRLVSALRDSKFFLMLIHKSLDLQDRPLPLVVALRLKPRPLEQGRRVYHPVVLVLENSLEVRGHLGRRQAVGGIGILHVEAEGEEDALVEGGQGGDGVQGGINELGRLVHRIVGVERGRLWDFLLVNLFTFSTLLDLTPPLPALRNNDHLRLTLLLELSLPTQPPRNLNL